MYELRWDKDITNTRWRKGIKFERERVNKSESRGGVEWKGLKALGKGSVESEKEKLTIGLPNLSVLWKSGEMEIEGRLISKDKQRWIQPLTKEDEQRSNSLGPEVTIHIFLQ